MKKPQVNPHTLKTYTAEEIEDTYKDLWCETMSEEAPWK